MTADQIVLIVVALIGSGGMLGLFTLSLKRAEMRAGVQTTIQADAEKWLREQSLRLDTQALALARQSDQIREQADRIGELERHVREYANGRVAAPGFVTVPLEVWAGLRDVLEPEDQPDRVPGEEGHQGPRLTLRGGGR